MVTMKKEGNVLFNDALNTFYFTVIWRRSYDNPANNAPNDKSWKHSRPCLKRPFGSAFSNTDMVLSVTFRGE